MTDMNKILYMIGIAILLGACTDEKFADPPTPGEDTPGSPVSVGLVLKTQPMQSPLSSATKGEGGGLHSTEVCKGMEISLVKTPVTRTTNANEDEIHNFRVLQFNGIKSTSVLIVNKYYTGSSVKEVALTTSIALNRIIVIANADGIRDLGDLQTGHSAITLADFEKLGIPSTSSGFPLYRPVNTSGESDCIILAGSTDMIVESGKQADIMLYRTVAKVQVNLTLSKKMIDKGFNQWVGQFMYIPKKSYYYSIGRNPIFPEISVGYTDYPQLPVDLNHSHITINPDGSKSFSSSKYLPVNLQESVPYTMPEQRRNNAPDNATYLQLLGIIPTASGAITNSVLYMIHLGANFTNDYSISPNYEYIYNITITDEKEDDSRVVKFIPGYFSGALKTYQADGVTETSVEKDKAVWRYEKRIEVYIQDVTYSATPTDLTGQWSSSSMPGGPVDLMDGRNNTWNLRDANYPAAQSCLNLNTTPASAKDLMWFLPSYSQVLGIYTAGSTTVKAFPNMYYWTSSATASEPWCIKIMDGESVTAAPSNTYRLRCIRELSETSASPSNQ